MTLLGVRAVGRLQTWLDVIERFFDRIAIHIKLESEERLLNGLSDQALADIGVTRGGIRQAVHARCPLCSGRKG